MYNYIRLVVPFKNLQEATGGRFNFIIGACHVSTQPKMFFNKFINFVICDMKFLGVFLIATSSDCAIDYYVNFSVSTVPSLSSRIRIFQCSLVNLRHSREFLKHFVRFLSWCLCMYIVLNFLSIFGFLRWQREKNSRFARSKLRRRGSAELRCRAPSYICCANNLHHHWDSAELLF
jgi:hypothetical protein